MIKIRKIEKEPIIIYYKNEKIGECHTLLSFQDVRRQIANEYLKTCDKQDDELMEYCNEKSDYSFVLNGLEISFKKDSTYDTIDTKNNWEDLSINFIGEILRLKYGRK